MRNCASKNYRQWIGEIVSKYSVNTHDTIFMVHRMSVVDWRSLLAFLCRLLLLDRSRWKNLILEWLLICVVPDFIGHILTVHSLGRNSFLIKIWPIIAHFFCLTIVYHIIQWVNPYYIIRHIVPVRWEIETNEEELNCVSHNYRFHGIYDVLFMILMDKKG